MHKRPLSEVAILAAPTWRSRAYAQRLEAAGIQPSVIIALPGEEPNWSGPDEVRVNIGNQNSTLRFRPGVPATETWDRSGVDIIHPRQADINSTEFIEFLRGLSHEVVIYSGFGGVIVGKTALSVGKRFLHIHGGHAPDYRGSTAFYFSILKEGTIGATALWLDPGIDTGPIVTRRTIALPTGVEIDRILDPLLRAQVLCDVLEQRLQRGTFPTGTHYPNPGEIFHVIHPVLKHIALNRCSLVTEARS